MRDSTVCKEYSGNSIITEMGYLKAIAVFTIVVRELNVSTDALTKMVEYHQISLLEMSSSTVNRLHNTMVYLQNDCISRRQNYDG